MDTSRIIIAPIVSEKSMTDVSKGRYTFSVDTHANKNEIRKEIERKFKVNILKISTITVKGRKMKSGARRLEISKSPSKKAIVTVKEGQKISIFDQGA